MKAHFKAKLNFLNLLLVLAFMFVVHGSVAASSEPAPAIVVGFNKLTPANGSTIDMPTNTYRLLQWTDALISTSDVYQYCIDTTNNNSCDNNKWVNRDSLYSGGPGDFTLTPGKTYYWQVRVRDANVYGNGGGTWWSFTISPTAATFNKVTPANGSIVAMPTSTYYFLQWTNLSIPSTDRYQYCIDTTNNNSCDGNKWITKNALYSGPVEFTLIPGTTYYWQVRARDAGTTADGGTWWSFSVSGSAPALNKITPANGSTIALPANTYYLLQWTNLNLPSTDRYQYCIDTTNNNTCDNNTWVTRNSLYSGSGEFTLTPGKTYYWQVRARDAGTTANGGAWWSFTISGSAPTLNKVTPANGSTIPLPSSDTYYLLQWTNLNLPASDRYQYCIDTTNNNSCDGGNWITRNSLYSGPGEFTLTPGKTYYWQVRARDAGTAADGGTWWSFSVSGSAPALNKITPTNGSTVALPSDTFYFLQWTNLNLPSSDRYQYCIDTTNNNSCDGGNWITRNSLYSGPGEFTLTSGKTYYWQVRARDAGTTANGGAWWSFTISGSAPALNKITPANGSTIALPSDTYYLLQWTNLNIASTDRYQYCIDTTNNNSCDNNSWITRNSLYSGSGEFALTPGKTYYWQVRARDAGTIANGGAWWSFTISGSAPTLNKVTPANGSTISLPVDTYYLLQWTNLNLPSTDRYQYCIDTTNNNSCDGGNWITRNSLYSGSGEFTLTPGTTYYWQVRARDAGTTANGGTWWSFSTAAIQPPPSVVSIVVASSTPTTFTVTFSQPVVGVDISDFVLTTTGTVSASITGVSGADNTSTRTITVDITGSAGTVRVDLVDDDTIRNSQSTPLGGVGGGNGNFIGGQVHNVP